MRTKCSLVVVFLVALVIGSPAAFGQRSVFVSPVPGIPFTAVVTVRRNRVLPNGVTQSLKSMHAIARDAQGRIFNDWRTWVLSTSNDTPSIIFMHIYDPQARLSTRLIPRVKIAIQQIVQRPPRTQPPALEATLAGNSAPLSQLVHEEDLGTRTMEGVPAHGVRETQTISAADSGTRKEIKIVDEYWYSEDLRLDMLIKHSDPRTGDWTVAVTQVSRTDPDPVIFTIPSDYKVSRPGIPSPVQKTN